MLVCRVVVDDQIDVEILLEETYETALRRAKANRDHRIVNHCNYIPCNSEGGSDEEYIACVKRESDAFLADTARAHEDRIRAIEQDPYTRSIADYFCSLVEFILPRRPSPHIPAPGRGQ